MPPYLTPFLRERKDRPRILVVDDQPTNIRVIHGLFKDDCDLYMATDGEQAIAQCDAHLPDLILLDVMMPGVDGHEVCRRLKAHPRTADIPIIFLTAQHNEDDEARGFELGAVDFITKPINSVIVRARVRTHLALKFQTDLLKNIALLDGLTGVANRRKLDEDLGAQWLQCARNQQPLSLILIDVDFFKRYNDHYGHQQGDDCLRKVAEMLRLTLKRPLDTAGRYGGEEFMCILPETDLDGACRLAEQILAAIRGLGIAHAQSEIDGVVTVSLGVASTLPKHERAPLELIEAADRMLYEAKRNGRARHMAAPLV